MEKNHLKRHKPSTGDRSSYYHETSAVNDLAAFNSSAEIGNLADVLKRGPVLFPNILAPDSFKTVPISGTETSDTVERDNRK